MPNNKIKNKRPNQNLFHSKLKSEEVNGNGHNTQNPMLVYEFEDIHIVAAFLIRAFFPNDLHSMSTTKMELEEQNAELFLEKLDQLISSQKAKKIFGIIIAFIKTHHSSNEMATIINTKLPANGMTLLHIFLCFGEVESVKRLLELGADLNEIDFEGRTPVYYLCHFPKGKMKSRFNPFSNELLELLVKYKANFDYEEECKRRKENCNFLSEKYRGIFFTNNMLIHVSEKILEMFEVTDFQDDDKDETFKAENLINKFCKLIGTLPPFLVLSNIIQRLSWGSDAKLENVVNFLHLSTGMRLIHFFICLRDVKSIGLLLDVGARINVPDNCGSTPVYYLFKYSHGNIDEPTKGPSNELLGMLIKAGANFDFQNPKEKYVMQDYLEVQSSLFQLLMENFSLKVTVKVLAYLHAHGVLPKNDLESFFKEANTGVRLLFSGLQEVYTPKNDTNRSVSMNCGLGSIKNNF